MTKTRDLYLMLLLPMVIGLLALAWHFHPANERVALTRYAAFYFDALLAGDYDSFPSPDGRYELRYYRLPMLVAMPGSGGDNSATVALYDQQRWLPIRLLISGEPEGVLYRSLDFPPQWENQHGKRLVYFARARIFEY